MTVSDLIMAMAGGTIVASGLSLGTPSLIMGGVLIFASVLIKGKSS